MGLQPDAQEPVGQLPLSGMPRRLYPCTPSRLAAWLDCPRRFRMVYVDRPAPPKGPPWAHNSFGLSVHNALRDWWLLPRSRRTAESAGGLVDRNWIGEGYRDDQQSQVWRERGRAMVASYAAGLDRDAEPIGVERRVATRTATLAVHGRVDRIDERDDEVVVVDYKTGRRALSTDDARGSLALALYAVAAARTFRRRCRRVELHHLPSGRVLGYDHSEESLARHVERAEAIAAEAQQAERRWRTGAGDKFDAEAADAEAADAEGADAEGADAEGADAEGADAEGADAVFPPRAGPLCTWCDYLRHCPEGRAVAAAKRPWDALADPPVDTAPESPEETPP